MRLLTFYLNHPFHVDIFWLTFMFHCLLTFAFSFPLMPIIWVYYLLPAIRFTFLPLLLLPSSLIFALCVCVCQATFLSVKQLLYQLASIT